MTSRQGKSMETTELIDSLAADTESATPLAVWVAIVTHNRLDLLKICLSAVLKQTRPPSKILVIDNASTDGTYEWLACQTGILRIRQSNLGSAGGFARAFRESLAKGAEWIWCLDDDCEPKADCLELLFEWGIRGLPYLAPNLVTADGQSHWEEHFACNDYPLISFGGGPYNGLLLRRDLIQRVGVPCADFFINGDETEYVTRIQSMGYPLITVRNALVMHPSTAFDGRNPRRLYYLTRNVLLCWRSLRNTPFYSVTWKRLGFLRGLVWILAKTVRAGNWYGIIIYLRAIWRGVHDQLSADTSVGQDECLVEPVPKPGILKNGS
jgi:GT2 family glycosyltransferase